MDSSLKAVLNKNPKFSLKDDILKIIVPWKESDSRLCFWKIDLNFDFINMNLILKEGIIARKLQPSLCKHLRLPIVKIYKSPHPSTKHDCTLMYSTVCKSQAYLAKIHMFVTIPLYSHCCQLPGIVLEVQCTLGWVDFALFLEFHEKSWVCGSPRT